MFNIGVFITLYFIDMAVKISGNSMAAHANVKCLPNNTLCMSAYLYSFGLHFYYEACKNLYAVSFLLAYFEPK